MAAINDITGDKIASKVLSEQGRENFDLIFRKKDKPYEEYCQQPTCDCVGFCTGVCDLEKCPYCGIRTENPCDAPPADYCEQAINKVHGAWLNDLS